MVISAWRGLGCWWLAAAGLAPAAAAPLSPQAATLLQQIVQSGDPRGAPFMLIDKRQAHVWVFNAQARPVGDTPVLLGLAPGDVSVPDIGTRPMQAIRPAERITPAGRFVVRGGRNLQGEDILWIDYGAAVSMHRLRNVEVSEKRRQRLASPSLADNRITYGCINVPPAFYDTRLKPLFSPTAQQPPGIAYVLPEVLPVSRVFRFGSAPRKAL